MKKLAVFVEGQTEQIFIERLLLEIANRNNIEIESRKASGGRSSARTTELVRKHTGTEEIRYYILIFDCGSENRVASDIKDRYDGLVRSGYTKIVGIRDVFPGFTYSDIPRLRRELVKYIPTIPVEVLFALGVMEVESWFLAEANHYLQIHESLTDALIAASTGINVRTDDLQQRPNPAADLHVIYSLANLAYNKSRANVARTINVLDYPELYLNMGNRFPDLNNLNQALTEFLS